MKSISPALRGTSYAGSTSQNFTNPERVESNPRFIHPQSHASIAGKNFGSHRFLHQRPSPISSRPGIARGIASLPRRHFDQSRLPTHHRGGVEDHVHLLCALSRTCNAAEMVKEVKRGSSMWIKTKSADLQDFAWQSGYGIFSVGFSQIESVKEYIAGQEEHHRKVSFQDEFRQLLKRYEIEFDEQYVWD
jgi:REP element-mobilizing transposase RayT